MSVFCKFRFAWAMPGKISRIKYLHGLAPFGRRCALFFRAATHLRATQRHDLCRLGAQGRCRGGNVNGEAAAAERPGYPRLADRNCGRWRRSLFGRKGSELTYDLLYRDLLVQDLLTHSLTQYLNVRRGAQVVGENLV